MCTSFLGSCFILYSLFYMDITNDNFLFIIHNNDYLGYFKNFSIVLMLTIPIIFTLLGLIVQIYYLKKQEEHDVKKYYRISLDFN